MQHVFSFGKKIIEWWKSKRTTVKGFIVVGVAVVLLVVFGGSSDPLVTETALRQDLSRSVAATGAVVSTTDLSLSFQETNLVRTIYVTVGDKVRKGQILATLENSSEAASVASARGALLAAEARARKTVEGTSGDEVRSAEVAVQSARRTLLSSDLIAKDEEGLSVGAPDITGAYNGSLEGVYTIEFDRSMNEITFGGIEQGRMSVSTTPKALGTKGLLIAFPEGAARSIGTQWSIEIPNKNGDSYIKNLNAYNEASAALALKKTVAPSDVDVSQADVVSAQASLASAQAAFEKTVIRAPSDGTVTKIDVKLGQLAEAFSPVISIQDVGNLYIEANVNESNISHVVVGQPVSVTYDALGRDKVFMTTVSSVDLGATVVDGIVNYKVKAVVPDTTNIRSGMTANLSIQTAFVPNSVVIPERVITVSKEGVQSVEVLVDERKGRTENRTVTTGLVGDGGLVEITSGLSEGERALFSAK